MKAPDSFIPGSPESAPPSLPLAGIKVIDLATFIAGPFCASMLAEFGAEVIKVEEPGKGDPLRRFGKRSECGDSLTWLSEARNRKSITLNLRSAEGAGLLKRLVATADVLIENFRPGTLEKWGLGYDELSRANPGLVMLRVSGYGQTGPLRSLPGFARIAHAFGGLAHMAREPGGVPVIPGSTSLADYSSGLYGALGVMVALRERDKSGIGQVVDVALFESIFRMMDEMVPAFDRYGLVREPLGADTVNIVPHSHYLSGDGKWLAIACSNDKMFERLCVAMGRQDLIGDPRYATIPERDRRRGEVNALVAEWVDGRTALQVLEQCRQGEVPCSLLYNIADIFQEEQYEARQAIVSVEDGRAGALKVPGIVPKLSRTPGRVESLGPALGAHNFAVYQEAMGISAQEVARLIDEGVI
ncbi:CaiB/BaiF CoA transferase family protein [Pollutimonas bauzanensis]|uniref:Crotonobetainyl-CoA:carnitine CoA-transferase CaiB n=1 Tax=Pollutimonas bauzanensis TaxID=658167 RepID=A0A1M5PVA6_9BURK|nr:CoA transferase [Pollutimonas bauzanensis]SHH05622.1 Crotonobetainyl-CoA:carnitine CoA-transferase CaiB [Pollutimonas bauzanensis]